MKSREIISQKLCWHLLFISVLSGCSVTVTHPRKGKSLFSHRPSKDLNPAFNKDLMTCKSFAEKMLIKSGMKFYRNQHWTIRECLKDKGWEFYP